VVSKQSLGFVRKWESRTKVGSQGPEIFVSAKFPFHAVVFTYLAVGSDSMKAKITHG